jgi:hypothetical protein
VRQHCGPGPWPAGTWRLRLRKHAGH